MDAFLSVASMLFSNAWRMLTSIDFPGLGVPVAYVMIADKSGMSINSIGEINAVKM